MIVVEAPLSDDTKHALMEALRHENLSCPARGLELVVYDREAAGSTAQTRFRLDDVKPIQAELGPVTNAACNYAKWPEVKGR